MTAKDIVGVKKDRFKISADELEALHQRKLKEKDEPIKKAVTLLEAALDSVLTKLGVDVTRDDIPQQQEQLGIMITEETREEMWGLNGFFIFVARKGELIPYGWIGAARLNSQGECFVDIQYFQDNRLEETGGIKIIGG